MLGGNIKIKKGAVFAYRLYDIAQEIDLKKAQTLLEQDLKSPEIRRYQIKNDPLRSITFRVPPLIISGIEEDIEMVLNGSPLKLKSSLEIKFWDYGVMSLAYRLEIPEDLSFKDLVSLGAILDSDSVIDENAQKKKEEMVLRMTEALKKPFTHSLFEDYTTYLIEELSVKETKKAQPPQGGELPVVKEKTDKMDNPIELLRKTPVAELLLAEPNKTLADVVKKSVMSNVLQYTTKDCLVLDWNSALVFDFTKEKEYQDNIDMIEFSLSLSLELRIYKQILDESTDKLYDSIENNQSEKITDFYSEMREESGRLYMEFLDIFDKLDSSITTVGDAYLAKVLRMADKKLGLDEMKQTMSRKIDTLAKISSMYQDKIDSLIDERRNKLSEQHTRTAHLLEIMIILLIFVPMIPSIPAAIAYLREWWEWIVIQFS